MEVIADKVIGLLGASAAEELQLLSNFQDDREAMESKITGISALLRDAERKAKKSKAINDSLQKLKDTLLDAEDLLDAYYTEELARKVITKDKMAKEVRIFFSKYNRIACARKIGRKIKAIRMKIDNINNEKNPFLLNESSSSTSNESNEWRRIDPYVSDQDVVGRDKERKDLVGTLLNPDVGNDVSVVPIVGIGGLGKTTLAQQVYDDVAVKKHFELQMWVCVSDESRPLSNNMLAQKIIEQGTNTKTHQACQELRRKIEGKIFLLVLDDVWNIKDRGEWLKLENLLRGGRKGSMIIVTTRSEKVAYTMGSHSPIFLKDLDEDKSWILFCMVAFRDGKEPENKELVVIGRDIVRRCSGVPLAIRTIGSLLFTKRLGVSEWSYFRDNELENMDSDEEDKIFSILRLSYDHLPSRLKNCFAFCSLFPKDYLIERKTLIQLWIAEGFIIQPSIKKIQPLNKNMCLEDVGGEYLEQLLSRCLFQEVERDDFGDIECCKMHDLIHDLALSVTKNDYVVMSERIEEEEFGDRIRHVSSHFGGAWKFPFGNVKAKKVRTILSPKGHCEFIPTHSLSRCFRPTTSLPKHLRVLDLSHQWLKEISECIGDLKHLRYLDLTSNRIKRLPQGITKLYNLLTLRLNQCRHLIELPKYINRLVRLRHLELDGCNELICMPRGLGCLTNLQTLTTFVVNKQSGGDGAKISELHDLIGLRGLNIKRLERQRSNVKEVQSAKFLLHLPHLGELSLVWSSFLLEEFREGGDMRNDEIILEALEPPHTIKALTIQQFNGKCLPEWIGSLTSLQTLCLDECSDLASLPESIGSLTSLRTLSVHGCSALASLPESIGSLTSLRTLSLNGCSHLASLPESIGSLTLLHLLSLHDCSALASLPESIGSLMSLRTISLDRCSALASLPEFFRSLTSLQSLSLNGCSALASLPESIGSLTSLQHLSLSECSALASLPESIGSLTSLQHLSLYGCSALASLPESIGSLTSLQLLSLNRCSALASLPESIGSLTSLETLYLDECSHLASLPESIGSLTSLQLLSLNDCSALASLPESIGSLTSLERLYLDRCSASASLLDSIGSLTSLQKLSLNGYSAWASLPESIGSLTSLQTLSLNGCSALASLPEFLGSLTSLQSLSLNGCSALASLPEFLGSLTSLQSLFLNGCSALASLPESIGSLRSLEMLSLDECSALASLPKSIGSLTSLQILYFDR